MNSLISCRYVICITGASTPKVLESTIKTPYVSDKIFSAQIVSYQKLFGWLKIDRCGALRSVLIIDPSYLYGPSTFNYEGEMKFLGKTTSKIKLKLQFEKSSLQSLYFKLYLTTSFYTTWLIWL